MADRSRAVRARGQALRVAAFKPNLHAFRAEEQILNDPSYFAERPKLIALLRELRRARTGQQFFDLHLRLFRRFNARQQYIDELRGTLREQQQRKRRVVEMKPVDQERVREIQMVTTAIERSIEVEKALQSLLAVIADGIAWRALRYDRAKIHVLGTGTQVRRLADTAGLIPELLVIEEFWEQGVFAIHNDLTTCLRHGDVTAIHPDGRIEIIEVKRSAGSENPVQTQRGLDATTLINERRHTFADGQAQHILPVRVPYRTHLQIAKSLIPRARREGYASANVSPVQFAAVIDHKPGDTNAENENAAHERAVSNVSWWGPQSRIISFNATMRRMRDRRDGVPSLAPLSIYPFEVEDVADLMLGRLDLFTALNLDGLTQQFEHKGISVEIAHSDAGGADGLFLTARQDVPGRELLVTVTPGVREQMLIELMTPANAIAQISAMFGAVRAESSPARVERIPSMADEARVWES